MLAPNSRSSYNGRPSFVNPKYLKKAQSEKPCLYKIPYDKNDLANIFAPNRVETLILEEESRSKLDKKLIQKYDYTYQNSLYELFAPQTHKSLDELYFANETQKKMWIKSFVKYKPKIVKIIGFLPTQASDAPEFPEFFKINELKAQLQEKNIVIRDLKTQLQENTIANARMHESWNKMKGKGVDNNFGKPSILGKPPLQLIRNQPVIRQPTAFKSERSSLSKTRFASKVVAKHDFTKPVTPHSWPQARQSLFTKYHLVNAPGLSRNSSKCLSF
ncbi:hypothetical protein Tco_1483765 [Tanacetum coccineum]